MTKMTEAIRCCLFFNVFLGVMIMLRTLVILLMLCGSQAFAEPRLRPNVWAVPVIGTTLNNFYWVDDNIYRAEQPDEDSLQALAELGIKEILNLREYHSDADAAENQFTLYRVPMEAGSVTEEQLLAALRKIKNRKAPLLIHCWHGSDRTGVTVAAYRIIFQNWSREQAVDEMVNGGFGYHGTLYPNLLELINKLDVEKIKRQLQNGQ
jgi:protein tyrosine/serine phosphatase